MVWLEIFEGEVAEVDGATTNPISSIPDLVSINSVTVLFCSELFSPFLFCLPL